MRYLPCSLFSLYLTTLAPLADPVLSLEPIASGLVQPVFLTHAGDGSGRIFIVEQPGRIRLLKQGNLVGEPFLDIRDRVTPGGERGLLGLAFHPGYGENGLFYVNYTRTEGGQLKTVVSEFRRSLTNADVADPASERTVLMFDQPFASHNGGMVAFGPDGYLYVATGDGGSGGDPLGNGQSLSTLLGKILRIDVDRGNPYGIPADNPFATVQGARKEIWAFGLRNPWRFSFDRSTGRLFAGDVGQNAWEEVDLIEKGNNLGWNTMEGTHCYPPSTTACSKPELVLPISEYGRSEGSSVTGGYVYRGLQRTPLWGVYIFGDFVSGVVWVLSEEPGGTWNRRELLRSNRQISSFGEDEEGELYLIDYGGNVFRLRFGWREIFAHAGDGAASVGIFRSRIVLANNSANEVSGKLRFYSNQGRLHTVAIKGMEAEEFPVTIPGRSVEVLRTDGISAPFFVGWAEFEAAEPVEGVLLYELRSPAGSILAEAGVAASVAGNSFSVYAAKDNDLGVNTGIAIANPSATRSVEVSISVWVGAQETAHTHYQLGPREQKALFVDEFGPVPGQFEGTLRVDATLDVALTLLRTLNGIHSASLPGGKVIAL